MISKDIPLIGFTIFCQLSVGAILLYNFIVFLPTYRNKSHQPPQFKTIPFLVFTLAVVSVLFATFHLGHPLKAFRTLDNLSSSWLSREILVLIFYVFGLILFNLVLFFKGEWPRVSLILLNFTTLTGIILVYTMSRIYSAMPIPAWQPVFTLLNFIAATLTMGGGLMLLMNIQKGSLSVQQSLAWIIGIVLLMEIIFIPIFLSYLDQNSITSQLSLKILLEDYSLIFYFRLAFQLVSLGFISLTIVGIRSDIPVFKKFYWPVIGAALFIFLNEIFGRILFYGVDVPIGSL